MADWKELLAQWQQNIERKYPKLVGTKALLGVAAWYNRVLNELGDYTIEEAPMEDALWKVVHDDDGKHLRIERYDGTFFRVISVLCRKGKSTWLQPVLESIHSLMKVVLWGEEVEVPVYGLLMVIRDSEGKILLSIGQETMADTPKKAVVRLPLQASWGKILLMLAGKASDVSIEALMAIYDCQTVQELLALAVERGREPFEDLDRGWKNNVVWIMPTVQVGTELHEKLTSNGSMMWVDPLQWKIIKMSGLTGLHTVGPIDMMYTLDALKEYE